MLVWCFLFDVFFYTSTACTFGISGVENVNDDVRRIDDLADVKLRSLHLTETNAPCRARSIFSCSVLS